MKTLSAENQEHRHSQYRAKHSADWRMFWPSSKDGTYYRGDEDRSVKERGRNRIITRAMRAAS